MPDTSHTRLRLREVRQSRGLSQDGLAAKAGMDVITIRRLERGDFQLKWAMVKRLAEALDITLEDLIDPSSPAD